MSAKTPRLVNYEPLFRKAEAAMQTRAAAVRGTTSYKRKLDAITEAASRDAVPGDRYLREVERVLDSFEGFKRSDAQKDFHRAFITAVLPHIYGPADFERYGERIKRERGVEEMQQEVLVCCPRRFGKTTAVSMFVAALLYCVPDTWISCFSTGQRASTTLLDQAARFFNTLPGAKDKILKKNQEQFFTRTYLFLAPRGLIRVPQVELTAVTSDGFTAFRAAWLDSRCVRLKFLSRGSDARAGSRCASISHSRAIRHAGNRNVAAIDRIRQHQFIFGILSFESWSA